MIESSTPTGNTMFNSAWTCSTKGVVITLPPPSETRDFCLCKYEPSYCELAFYNLLDVKDEYTNDYHLEYINLKSGSSTYEFILIDESGNEYTIDDTLATIYENFNSDQPLMVGFNLQWWKVANTYGTGKYKIKILQDNFGTVTESESHYYNVVPFIQERANQTVKIEILLEGLTMNGRNWLGVSDNLEMTRVYGRLGVAEPQKEIEDNRLLNSSRSRIDVVTTVFNNYTLIANNLPSDISDFIMQEGTTMNWYVTDYNLFNKKDYRKILLLVESSAVLEDNPQYSRTSYEVSLTDKVIKENRKFV